MRNCIRYSNNQTILTLQEQRYMHLVNILNELKRQVEQQNQPQMHQASMPPKFQQQPQSQQQIQVQRAQLRQPQKRKNL